MWSQICPIQFERTKFFKKDMPLSFCKSKMFICYEWNHFRNQFAHQSNWATLAALPTKAWIVNHKGQFVVGQWVKLRRMRPVDNTETSTEMLQLAAHSIRIKIDTCSYLMAQPSFVVESTSQPQDDAIRFSKTNAQHAKTPLHWLVHLICLDFYCCWQFVFSLFITQIYKHII